MRTFTGFQKGVNLGGWISQFAEYDEQHFNSFITEEDGIGTVEMILILVGICIADKSRILCGNFRCI